MTIKLKFNGMQDANIVKGDAREKEGLAALIGQWRQTMRQKIKEGSGAKEMKNPEKNDSSTKEMWIPIRQAEQLLNNLKKITLFIATQEQALPPKTKPKSAFLEFSDFFQLGAMTLFDIKVAPPETLTPSSLRPHPIRPPLRRPPTN